MDIITPFDIEDRVVVDKDKSIVAVIVAILIESNGHISYKCSYFHEGRQELVWFDQWRLSHG